jgi:2,3-bisphosphoglycerate-independent phosphoglycerate mutase
MTSAVTDPAGSGFSRRRAPKLGAFVCLTSYGDAFAQLPAAFTPQSITHGFGEMVAERGLKQLRIADTEK